MKDMVNHPEHYISNSGIEVIDVIEALIQVILLSIFVAGNIKTSLKI